MEILPKISVIVPTLNQASFIEETLISITRQDYSNLELIVIDGGSTDNTMEIIKKFDGKISYLVSEKDKGQSNAINKGLQKSNGEIITWLNSDDFYFKGALSAVASYFTGKPNLKCLIGKLQFIMDKTPGRLSTPILGDTPEKTAGFINLSQPAMFFRKNVFEKAGYLNEEYHFCFDTEFWLKALMAVSFGDIVEVNDILAGFRLHKGSKTVMHGGKFIKEKDNIYYSLAAEFGFGRIASLIRQLEDIPAVKKSDFSSCGTDKDRVNRILNYYLYYRGDQYYYHSKRKKAMSCFKAIDRKALHKKDRNSLDILALKNALIPGTLGKFIRNAKTLLTSRQ